MAAGIWKYGKTGGGAEKKRKGRQMKMDRVQLAVSTDYAGEKAQLEMVKKEVGRIAEAGFTHVHWCHEWSGDYIYSVYEMQQIKEWVDEYGMQVKALHATTGSSHAVEIREGHYRRDYTSNWEYNRKAGVELIQNRVDLTQMLGATEIVLHLYAPYISFRKDPGTKEDFYACVCRSLDELKPYCLRKNVKICLENLFDMPGDCMLEIWDRLFDRYSADFLGLCYDTGHANMVWGAEAPDIVGRYADRLFAVHIHDNNGAMDSHWIPGEGSIDWEKVMGLLARSAYEAPLLMELSSHGEEEEQFLKRAYEAGCRLDRLYRDAL